MNNVLLHYNQWIRRTSYITFINTYYWDDIAE